MQLTREIRNIKGFPEDGKHLECLLGDLPFHIRKGHDTFMYHDKGKWKHYGRKDYDNRWMCELKHSLKCNQSLNQIFKRKLSKNLDSLIKYCTKIYLRSLKMEQRRIEKELKQLSKLEI